MVVVVYGDEDEWYLCGDGCIMCGAWDVTIVTGSWIPVTVIIMNPSHEPQNTSPQLSFWFKLQPHELQR